MSGSLNALESLKSYVDALKQVLEGDSQTSLNLEGVQIHSIAKHIEDEMKRIETMVKGRVAFASVEQMNASLAFAENTLCEVWNDPDSTKNGLYGKVGSDGAGHWSRSGIDSVYTLNQALHAVQTTLTQLTDKVANYESLQESVSHLKSYQDNFTKVFASRSGIHQYLKAGSEVVIPAIVDEDLNQALGFDANTGELVAAGLDRMATEPYHYVPVIVDEQERISLSVEKSTGQVLCDLHHATASGAMRKVGLYEVKNDNFAFAVVDDEQKIALAIDYSGNVIQSSSNHEGDQNYNKTSLDSDVNHFLFYGQSLSLGSAGRPAISLMQPYENLTFAGGPRADSAGLSSFKPLIEDNLPAPDGSTSYGETLCSGAANYVSELLQVENQRDPSTYKLLSSTAGHGGYTINQLKKGSDWYSLLKEHVKAGYVVSQLKNETYAVQALGWAQGENDQFDGSKSRADYLSDLITLQSDIEQDVKSITSQSSDVPLLLYQLSAYVREGKRNVTLAQLDATESNEKFVLVTPMYQFPYSDGLHLTSIGYRWLGHYYGKAYKDTVCTGKRFEPLRPLRTQVQGKCILIEFHVPCPPMVFDEQTLGSASNYGFTVESNGQLLAIDDVQIINGEQVKIILKSPVPANSKVRYGLDVIGDGLTHENGGSGNLRDSEPRRCTIGQSKYPLYNWCVLFEKEL